MTFLVNTINFKEYCLQIFLSFFGCCSARISRLSLIWHSLYVGVVEKTPPPPLTGEPYGKMEIIYEIFILTTLNNDKQDYVTVEIRKYTLNQVH